MSEEMFRLRATDLAWREVESEIVVLDLRSSRYLSINATGVVLWRDLEAGATRVLLSERLCEEFGISLEQAQRDVEAFLDMCVERDLVERSG